jgi:hypothetical protein
MVEAFTAFREKRPAAFTGRWRVRARLDESAADPRSHIVN